MLFYNFTLIESVKKGLNKKLMLFAIFIVIYIIVIVVWIKFKGTGAPEIIKDHEFFQKLFLYPKGDYTRWEADCTINSHYLKDGTIGFYAEDDRMHEDSVDKPEPTIEEIAFIKEYILKGDDFDGVFQLMKPALQEGYTEILDETLSGNWKSEFVIDGFSIPVNGGFYNKWTATFFCLKANLYFHIAVENGEVFLEGFDS